MILETLLAIGLNPQPSYLNNIDFKQMAKEHTLQINEYKTQNPIKSVYTKGNNVNLRNLEKREVVNKIENVNTELKLIKKLDDFSVVRTADNQTYYISNEYIQDKKKIHGLPTVNNGIGNVKSAPKTSGIKSYMPYKAITSVSSPQYKLQQQAYTGNHGIRMVNGRYCVALGSFYTNRIGQNFDLVLENGTVIPCVLADQKADGDTNGSNQVTSHNGCMSEFIVDSQALDRDAKKMGDISYCEECWKSPVRQIILY